LASNTAAAFDVFPGPQIPNDGLFDIVLESTPNGSDHADAWLFCIFAQPVSPQFMVANVLAMTEGQSKLKNGSPAYVSGTLERALL
jgi:hypothetical protein